MDMSVKELSLLTMKQIREYAVMKGAKSVPKKWTDKPTALSWVEKNLGSKAEPKKEEVKKSTKKEAKPKTAKAPKEKKNKEDLVAIARRLEIVGMLRSSPCSSSELVTSMGNTYKSILDDLHAIRHNRKFDYIKDDEVLLGTYVGKQKAFQIVKKKDKDKKEAKLKEEIVIE